MFALVKKMNIEDIERQRILEASTARERIMLLTPMLQREQQRARTTLEKRIVPREITLN